MFVFFMLIFNFCLKQFYQLRYGMSEEYCSSVLYLDKKGISILIITIFTFF